MKKFIVCITTTVLFYSCQHISDHQHEVSTAPLDTIQSAPVDSTASPADFETTFSKGTSKQVGTTSQDFFGITIGTIKLTTGRVIICDPLHMDEYGIPFTQLFPIGTFPVQLAVLQVDEEASLAFARIKFSDEPVVRWEMALREKQPESLFGGDHPEKYCIDGGVAILLDQAASKVLDQEMADNFDGPLFHKMYEHHHIGWRYTMYDFESHNLAAFTTGLGDGCYQTYIGFDANGTPCRLLTDFNLVNWKTE